MYRQRKRRNWVRIACGIFLIVWLVLALLPIYSMVLTSIKSSREISRAENPLTVKEVDLGHYKKLFTSDYKIWLVNSLIVSGAVTAIAIPLAILGAYGIVRFKFRGKALLSISIFICYLMPRILLGIGLFVLFHEIGLINSRSGLILAYLTFVLPFSTWVLIGYFRNLPVEVEEQALVDGCSRIGALVRVTIPLAAPGIMTVFLFAFTLSWTEFIYPLLLISDSVKLPVPVGIAGLVFGDLTIWGQMMAGGMFYSIPAILIYILLRRFIVGGLATGTITSGAIK